MFEIHSGKHQFYQWDAGQKLVVNYPNCKQVHFVEKSSTEPMVCLVYEYEGKRVVDVPNVLFLTPTTFQALAYVIDEESRTTTYDRYFTVLPRVKPSDYIYTETEAYSYATLAQDITNLRESLPDMGKATVGQILMVKAVDENGKPTQFQPVNIALEKWEFTLQDGTVISREVYVNPSQND